MTRLPIKRLMHRLESIQTLKLCRSCLDRKPMTQFGVKSRMCDSCVRKAK